MQTEKLVWDGASDHSRSVPTDYFIPKFLQSDFGRITQCLRPAVTDERYERFLEVSRARSRRVLAVFEHTHHSHNISAVLRTLDALGFQDVFFVYGEGILKTRYKDSVERGSSTWLCARRARSIADCGKVLKDSGYKIGLVSLPTFSRTSGFFADELPSFAANEFSSPKFASTLGESPLALVFGSEMSGVSKLWLDVADMYLHVPMFGFVESLNVSVCAGILLQRLRESFVGQSDKKFFLTPAQQALMIEHWLAKSVDKAMSIVERTTPEALAYFEFLKRGDFFQPLKSSAT